MLVCLSHGVDRMSLSAVLVVVVVVSSFAIAGAPPVRIAFLAIELSLEEIGPHNRAAWPTRPARIETWPISTSSGTTRATLSAAPRTTMRS